MMLYRLGCRMDAFGTVRENASRALLQAEARHGQREKDRRSSMQTTGTKEGSKGRTTDPSGKHCLCAWSAASAQVTRLSFLLEPAAATGASLGRLFSSPLQLSHHFHPSIIHPSIHHSSKQSPSLPLQIPLKLLVVIITVCVCKGQQ